MDFIHDDDPFGKIEFGKIELWRRGINRAYTQHPYAAILIGRHAFYFMPQWWIPQHSINYVHT